MTVGWTGSETTDGWTDGEIADGWTGSKFTGCNNNDESTCGSTAGN